MNRLLAVLLLLPTLSYAAFDDSEYRATTYGASSLYCDLTLSIAAPSGSGTLGDPWNATRCMSEPVAGNVVRILPVGAGTPVDLTAPNSRTAPAFTPANSGTYVGSTCTAYITYVTKYAAVALTYSGIESNQNRSEIRHAGTDDDAGVAQGTGGSAIGVNTKDCVIFDGFFVDMAQIGMRNDAGVLAAWSANGIQFKNFVIKGKTTNMETNATLLRTENVVDVLFENYYIQDFFNPKTGGATQNGETSIHYGSRNVRHTHFHIKNTDRGLFLKGTAPAGVNFNYGTFQYGIVESVSECLSFNDLHASETTTVQYVLCVPNRVNADLPNQGINFNATTTAIRNLTVDHVTVAKMDASSVNDNASLFTTEAGLGIGSNVSITNSVFDNDNGANGHQVLFLTQLPATLNYNCYSKNGGTETWVYNSVEYNTIANWRTATSLEANSIQAASVGFADRSGGDYRVTSGSCSTGSSTGGQIGAYAASETIGIDIATEGSTPAHLKFSPFFLRR